MDKFGYKFSRTLINVLSHSSEALNECRAFCDISVWRNGLSHLKQYSPSSSGDTFSHKEEEGTLRSTEENDLIMYRMKHSSALSQNSTNKNNIEDIQKSFQKIIDKVILFFLFTSTLSHAQVMLWDAPLRCSRGFNCAANHKSGRKIKKRSFFLLFVVRSIL